MLQNLKYLENAPSIPFQDVPEDFYELSGIEKKKVMGQKETEFYDEKEVHK